MQDQLEISPDRAAGLRIAVATSRYHDTITSRLRDGAAELFREAGGAEENLQLVDAPGAFELTAVCRELAHSGRCDAIVALGCVITGETTHDQYICQAVAQGLTMITVQTGVPVTFGLLTCQDMDQASARAGGAKGNKGAEAMAAAIAASRIVEGIRSECQTGQPLTP